MLQYFRPVLYVPEGEQNKQDFLHSLKQLFAIKEQTHSETEMLVIFKYLRNNTRWVQADFFKFARAVVNKIKEFHSHPIYSRLITVLPVRLCQNCLCFTDNYQRVCKQDLYKQLCLYKLLPIELVRYVISFIGVYSRKYELKLSTYNKSNFF